MSKQKRDRVRILTIQEVHDYEVRTNGFMNFTRIPLVGKPIALKILRFIVKRNWQRYINSVTADGTTKRFIKRR